MPVVFWALGAATVIFAGAISYAMTRRYGWGAGLALPLLALVAMIAMQWQRQGLTAPDGLRMAGSTLIFAAPILLGVVAGILELEMRDASRLLLLVQPAHLQRCLGREMEQDARAEARATMLRSRLG